MLYVYSLLVELFIAQLKDKVRGGMKGAAGRDACGSRSSIGRPPLGYGLVPAIDSAGQPEINPDGTPKMMLAKHPTTLQWVLTAFKWYALKGKTRAWIAGAFNRDRVDGSASWTGTSIQRLLTNPAYIGLFFYNRFRTEYDPESRKRKRVQNPCNQWVVRRIAA